MSIPIIKGSLTDLELLKKHNIQVIAHCANCFCVMGAGVAASISKTMPYAYVADCETMVGDIKKLGKITVGSPSKEQSEKGYPVVYNLYGQYNLGSSKKQVDYTKLQEALESMLIVESNYISTTLEDYLIGIPYLMGCGLAGGDWSVVEPMIKKTFDKFGLTDRLIYVDFN